MSNEANSSGSSGGSGCGVLIFMVIIAVIFFRGCFGDTSDNEGTSSGNSVQTESTQDKDGYGKDPDEFFTGSTKVSISIEYGPVLFSDEPTLSVTLNNCKLGEIAEGQDKKFLVSLNEGEKYTLRIVKKDDVFGFAVDESEFKVTASENYFQYEIRDGELIDTKIVHEKS